MVRKKIVFFLKWVIALSITFGLILWAEQKLGWVDLLSQWGAVPYSVIFIAISMTMLSHLLRGVRLTHAYHHLDLDCQLNALKVIAVSWIHNAANFILPMRLGEIVLPALSRYQLNIPIKSSVSSLIGIRLFDLHVLILLVLIFQQYLPRSLQVTLIILLLLGLCILPWCKNLPVIKSFFPAQYLTAKSVILSYALSLMIWGVKLVAFYWVFSYFASLDFVSASLGILLADLSSTLPINGLASAGSYEAAFAAGLMINEPLAQGLLGPIINLHIFLLLSNIVAAVLGLLVLAFRS